METGKVLTAQERIDAANKRRAEKSAAETLLKLEQQATDLEAIADLEEEHGFDRVRRIELTSWAPGRGAPTSIAVRIPLNSEKNCAKFSDRYNRAKAGSKEQTAAAEDLAKECWAYPAYGSDGYKAALELAPMILNQAATQILLISMGVAEQEGKG